MGMTDLLTSWMPGRRSPVASVAGLAAFLDRHAAFLAQKCSDDYVRGTVGLNYHAMSQEPTFKEAMTICRWDGFAAMLAGLILLTQRRLIEAGGDAAAIESRLARLFAEILAGHPPPAHRPTGWGELVAAMPARLAEARKTPPSLRDIAAQAASRLFEVLPIHARYRELDEEVIHGAVQFRFVSLSDRIQREIDAAALARAIAADEPP